MIVRLRIRACLDYKCAGCGAYAQGTTTPEREIRAWSKEEAQEALERVLTKLSAHDMPVGWASFHGIPHDFFKCPNCQGS